MPELPDVEVQRRHLAETSLHKRIKRVIILDTYVIKGVSSHEFKSVLEGARFEDIERRGKFLEVSTDSQHDLAVHFGMTGCLKYVPTYSVYEKYTRVIFTFVGNHDLRYVTMRKLGGLYLVPKGKFTQIAAIRKMGIEPLSPEFDLITFKEMIGGRSAVVKALLLDQGFIAGIGNIYADEILFQAGIRPDRRISELDEKETIKLFRETKVVLRGAVQHKTGSKDEASFLALRRNESGICPRCGSRIRKLSVSSRTSYYCERCQR